MTILATHHDKALYRAALADVLSTLGNVLADNADNENLGRCKPGIEVAGQVVRRLYPGPGSAPLPEWLAEIERETSLRADDRHNVFVPPDPVAFPDGR